MAGDVQIDEPPCTFVVFHNIDAAVVLLDLPKMIHSKPHKIAEDDLIDGVMGSDEKGFPVVCFCILIKGSAGSSADIFQGFSVRHLYLFRMGVP